MSFTFGELFLTGAFEFLKELFVVEEFILLFFVFLFFNVFRALRLT